MKNCNHSDRERDLRLTFSELDKISSARKIEKALDDCLDGKEVDSEIINRIENCQTCRHWFLLYLVGKKLKEIYDKKETKATPVDAWALQLVGNSYKEIADKLGFCEKSVKTRLYELRKIYLKPVAHKFSSLQGAKGENSYDFRWMAGRWKNWGRRDGDSDESQKGGKNCRN